MTIVYWRHADDDELSPRKRHDPCATGRGRSDAERLARKMVRRYGPPDVIYLSPMRRCRDTARSMLYALDKIRATGTHPAAPMPRIVLDENLSRYFCHREQRKPRVRASTGSVPIYERWSDFRRRVQRRAEFIERLHAGPGQVAWCITHALVLKEVALHYGARIPEWLDFLFHFVPGEQRRGRRRSAGPAIRDALAVPGGNRKRKGGKHKRKHGKGSAHGRRSR